MAPMKREQQWDMFDVATGACELDDYLQQRYSESDLRSKMWVEAQDQLDELRAPPEGSKEQVVIPVQRPATDPTSALEVQAPLPTRPPWEAAAPEGEPLPSRPSWEKSPAAPPVPPAPHVSRATPPSREPIQPVASEGAPAWTGATPEARQQPVVEPAVRAPVPPSPPEDEPELPAVEPPSPPSPPSMEELLARFHQAAKAYEERSKEQHEPS